MVAIVGRGIDPHPEFEDRLLEGTALTGDLFDTHDTCPYDTHLAGIIAAARNNVIGVAGLNDRVQILPVRVFDGCAGLRESVAEGIIWATDEGASLILVPMQFDSTSDALSNAVSYAATQDVVVIAPAGSLANPEVLFPAALSDCMAVARAISAANRSV